MFLRRTDLAVEARDFFPLDEKNEKGSLISKEEILLGYSVASVEIRHEAASKRLGKPCGLYLTLDLASDGAAPSLRRGAQALSTLLSRLLHRSGEIKSVLVVGLGNAAMTPDALGPAAAEQVLVTRHLKSEEAFAAFSSVSVLQPGVLGKTGLEAAQTVRGAVDAVRPDVVLAIDALAAARMARVCTTVQLSDAGIVPGSGVGNHRNALNEETLGVPVIAIGVPTVVDARTLSLDVLEEAGIRDFDPALLQSCGADITVTPRDIDAKVAALARIIGYGINLALQPQLDFDALSELLF